MDSSTSTLCKIESLEPAGRVAPGPEASRAFDWPVANDAEQFLRERVASFLKSNLFAHRLAEGMRAETATDLFEWIDHLVLGQEEEAVLREVGYVPAPQAETLEGEAAYQHPRATLPQVLLRRDCERSPSRIALRPESVADFMACHNLPGEPEGEPFSRYRRILVSEEDGATLEAVERRGYRGYVPAKLKPGELTNIIKARERWQTRQRLYPSDAEGFRAVHQTLDRVLDLVGPDVACLLFFEAERAYWQSRNRAARMQKHRQDRLGLGWGNHDHHTFRCSREHFVDLIEFLLKLGFIKRERLYAGAEAGWGAQIAEQPIAGIVVFADVDLMPEEKRLDFSALRLPRSPRLGTVGLWVGLHGESLLEAGMHHLEARFNFDFLRAQFKEAGVNTMTPFSDFPFLRQAFTEGERWPVRRERAERLLSDGLITREQYDQFIWEGALGSHLENLERHGGFKGFNQQSVSAIIAATDPRIIQFPHDSAAA
jgi:hypothetical protein